MSYNSANCAFYNTLEVRFSEFTTFHVISNALLGQNFSLESQRTLDNLKFQIQSSFTNTDECCLLAVYQLLGLFSVLYQQFCAASISTDVVFVLSHGNYHILCCSMQF